jgi:hypothetical protein
VWDATSRELNEITLSYELVVHSHTHIVDVILAHAAEEGAGVAMRALCAVLAAAARDLGADFVGSLPRIFAAFAGVATANASDPPTLQALFRCVLALLRTLHPHLLGRAPWVSQISRDLRYHAVYHIRCFAAKVRCV